MLVLQANVRLEILDWGPRLTHHIDLQFKKKKNTYMYVCLRILVYKKVKFFTSRLSHNKYICCRQNLHAHKII